MAKLTPQAQLEQLLAQIQLPEELHSHFENGELTSVDVFVQRKQWHFSLKLAQILPVDVLVLLQRQMRANFENIAHTTLAITVEQAVLADNLIENYWPFIVQQLQLPSGAAQQLVTNTDLQVAGTTLTLATGSQQLFDYVQMNLAADLRATYAQYGFPALDFVPKLDQNLAQQIAQTAEMHRANGHQMIKEAAKKAEEEKPKANGEVVLQLGRKISPDAELTRLEDIVGEESSVIVEGYIFDSEIRELKSGRKLLTLKLTDYSSSISAKKFSRDEGDDAVFDNLGKGLWVRLRGNVQEDTYQRELVFNIYDLQVVDHQSRADDYDGEQKRIELHAHSSMSALDAVTTFSDAVKLAAKWGHEAFTVVDTGNVQGFPEAAGAAKKNGVKMIYGMEANVVEDGEPIAFNPAPVNLTDPDTVYVVFDLETTGLSAIYDKIIELSAVKMQAGNVIGEFSEFINPGFPLSETTINLTSITDAMVANADTEENVFRKFREFYGDAVLIGHNVTFDVGFMNTGFRRYGMAEFTNPIIDTLTLARFLHPDFRSYRLNTLAKKFGIVLEQHHRAIFDSETTGHLAWQFVKDAKARYGIERHDQLNDYMTEGDAWKHARPFHATILVQNQIGLKNLFKLVSLSNTKFFNRVARIPRSLLQQYREGLLIGSGDNTNDVWEALMQKGEDEAREKAKFYDYLEIQPSANYAPQIEAELISSTEKLHSLHKQMLALGDELNKPVVVTGDVKYLNPEDAIYRKILLATQAGNPANRYQLPELYLRSTAEIMADFESFLDEATARQIVIDNTHLIADMIDDVAPMKDGSYPPNIPEAADQLREMTRKTALAWYGNPIPDEIQARIDFELNAIIGNGFAPHYIIAQRLVSKSEKDGYLVGSRGSVGSSFVATLTGITEVNPLPPHYRSAHGDYLEFVDPKAYESGYDLPAKADPNHPGEWLIGDGQNIPFETFMGFKGDKVPDIDLNFSGDYQPIAHNYMKVLFGENNVYRAGTIATVAEKTAFGYVKGYERDHELTLRSAEEERLAAGITGVKRTTGQHPGGILIVPREYEVYDFTPVQFPADDQSSLWQTTHLDYHSIHDNLLKMDILGHDDPTMIRTLKDMSGIDPKTIPVNDPGVLSLFTSPKALGVEPEQIFSKTGTLGLPEFGTNFVRGMLEETQPKNYSELLQISGLSHGTDVWLGNANELIEQGLATIGTVIGTRDKIMTDLINYGLEPSDAFNIMEKVRKGKGITEEYQAVMREHDVPEWYIQSCLKIKYMFPRAHAAAYVLMALRIAYFKVYFPAIYYAAYFSVRASMFDIVAMARGKETTKAAIQKIKALGREATMKDKETQTVLEMANEALERGIVFKMVDLDRSEALDWVIDGDTLIAPFIALPGLGDNVAKQIVAARAEKPFLSKEDLKKRGKVSQTLIDFMDQNQVLTDMPDENQLSLF
ncbi:MAG TPA: PolC-type DNA polymerase III [Lactobacillaceae bacterium]